MALDNAEKRRSAGHVARLWSGAGVTPNAAKDAEWRQEAIRIYSGFATDAGGPSGPGTPGPDNYRIRRVRRRGG